MFCPLLLPSEFGCPARSVAAAVGSSQCFLEHPGKYRVDVRNTHLTVQHRFLESCTQLVTGLVNTRETHGR